MAAGQAEIPERKAAFRFHWWWVLLLLLLLGFALFGERGVLRLVKTYNQRQELQLQVEQLQQENARLRQEITALKEDRSTIERIARQELGMVREDEIIFQFPGQKKGPTPPPDKTSAP